ncbi:translation initiation factor IF-2 N-terminal domain-containing protein [Corynebacterium sp.]|uniref:translation initiation factor IF-2 N-terminal domain-containing protein n=1 Tax=Corynebacterium sp. TaxID=1720 RepID=UPI002A91C4EB|nr:translation initiation factor IF-2 N-terminal domain-containing protein [Corynebacterium sp.]MDY5784873.1 translation initiation factor IF-2 N-terminal domain-containing protein [Corynebacterium sp.]
MTKKADNKPAATFDRSALGEKTRVFQLAKQLEIPSKELVVTLNELGLVKVAQSTLTRAEVEQLLDALESPNSPVNTVDAEAGRPEQEEKIRQRVRKDVENEIHQIEEKVEAELSDAAGEPDAEDAEDAVGSEGAVTVEEDSDELLTNVEPEVTPAPETGDATPYTPLFKPPSRAERRRASRAGSAGKASAAQSSAGDAPEAAAVNTEKHAEEISAGSDVADASADNEGVEQIEEPKGIKGSARLEAQRRRRTERREEGRKRSRIVSQAEFLARRESVERTMVVRERNRRDGAGRITQVGVLEDGLLVEHFVTSDQNASMIGNIYLGRVQNVLPSMEAAFIDIGQGRNGVLYAGEVDWKAAGLGGRSRRIEQALKSGDQVLVQVSKDPIGHKGARLTTQISLAGRFLVYVPGGRSAGISRKLPAPERKRLKEILNKVVPGKGGTIIRTAAEGVPEEAIAADVNRLHTQWEAIQEQAEKEKKSKGAKPVTLYEEPNLLVKVVRDLYNDDFSALIVDGKRPWNIVHAYVSSVAPDLVDRLERYDAAAHGGQDAFEAYRIDEQIQKALSRTVWLPSGGTLIIERTEAMTVIDVNTGKFTGSGGSLEETVTRNNLEAAEEIVRQMRLRDLGGMIIVDFIDMILPENQELVLRRLKEALGRDRTRHQVSEVTSLGLVQMTRKRLGTGLLETFSTPCEHCGGRGLILTEDPVDADLNAPADPPHRSSRKPARDDQPHQARAEDTPRKESQSVIALDEDALNEIADSVLGTREDRSAEDASGEPRDENRDENQDESRKERSGRGRRRGRRGGSRGRGRGAEVPETAESAPKQQRPEKQRPEKDESDERSFEQAVAEFEASPRRKRRTRGNSRSDHAPRREDFAQDSRDARESDSEHTPKQDERKGRQDRQDRQEQQQEQRQERSRGRGRRRAVRRSQATADGGSKVEERREGVEKRKKAEKTGKAGKSEDAAQNRNRESDSSRGRGRRRAVRKRSS